MEQKQQNKVSWWVDALLFAELYKIGWLLFILGDLLSNSLYLRGVSAMVFFGAFIYPFFTPLLHVWYQKEYRPTQPFLKKLAYKLLCLVTGIGIGQFLLAVVSMLHLIPQFKWVENLLEYDLYASWVTPAITIVLVLADIFSSATAWRTKKNIVKANANEKIKITNHTPQ